MNITKKVIGNSFNINYELTDLEIKILQFLKTNDYIQFRGASTDIEPDNLDDTKTFREVDIEALDIYDFIEINTNAWHREYNLSDIGKLFLENYEK
jgi:hypothetical protein